MHKKITIVFLSLYFLKAALSQTTIPAGNVSGTWTKAGSPYKIGGEIIVPKGSTLTLEPGAILEFGGNWGLKVDGILKAEGKKGDSITFKGNSAAQWAGIYYYKNNETDTIRFNYCRFENIGQGLKYNFVNYAIACFYGSPVMVKNSTFIHTLKYTKQGGCIYGRKNVLIVDSVYLKSNANIIESTRGSIAADSSLSFIISNIKTSIRLDVKNMSGDINILATIISADQKGILREVYNEPNSAIALSVSNSKNISISNINVVDHAFFGLGDSRILMKSSSFKKSNRTALNTSGNCTGSIIEDCLFENCGADSGFYFGVLDLQSSGPLFKSCLIKENKTAVIVNQKYGAGTPFFLNCNFSGSKGGAFGIEGYPVLINCNIQNNSMYKFIPGDTGLMPPYLGGVTINTEFYPSHPYFYNCLFWGNKDNLGHDNSIVMVGKSVKADFNHCIIQGDSSKGIVGYDDNTNKTFYIPKANLIYSKSNGNNPGFVDSANSNFQLTNACNNTAYAINKGMSGNLLTQYPFNILKSVYGIDIYNSTDLAGNPRVKDDTLDIGCYESSGTKKSLKLQSTYRDTTLCYGSSNAYTSKTYGTAQSYEWQYKTGSSGIAIATTPTLSLGNLQAQVSEYRLLVKNNECLPLKDSSAWFKINVNNPIKKGIVKKPNKDSIYQNETMQLSTNATGYKSLLWSNKATASSISFTGSSLGAAGKYQFSVEGRNNNGCLETDTVYIVTKSGNSAIHAAYLENAIRIYPQPATDLLNIEIPPSIIAENTWISVTTIEGKTLHTEKLNGSINQIPIGQLESGIYLITITDHSTKQALTLKWVKG